MKLKCAVLIVCFSVFSGSVLCFAQNENVAASKPAPLLTKVTGPARDFDTFVPNPGPLGSRAEHWRERGGGIHLDFLRVYNGVILGWSIYLGDDEGFDIWGDVGSDFTARWSTMGWSRWGYGGEVAYTSPYPYSSYTYVNTWGSTGSGTIDIPSSYYNGSLYESFFDAEMIGPGNVRWTEDGSSNWHMTYDNDPGNYIDNRVYAYAGNSVSTGWKATVYDYGYNYARGFSFNADVKRTDDDGDWAYGIFFFANSPLGPDGNCYAVKIADSSGSKHYFSVWKYTAGSGTALIPWFQDAAINPSGEWNNIKVDTLNGNMEFWCNGVSMGTAFDDSYRSGNIGVGVYDADGLATCEWDNITVHRQPSVKVGKGGNDPEPERILRNINHPDS